MKIKDFDKEKAISFMSQCLKFSGAYTETHINKSYVNNHLRNHSCCVFHEKLKILSGSCNYVNNKQEL